MDDFRHRILLSEIYNGCSIIFNSIYGEVYLKHFTQEDAAKIDTQSARFRHEALKDSIPSLEDKLKELDKGGIWTQKKEIKIAELTGFINNLHKTKEKMFKEIDRKAIQTQIDDAAKQIQDLEQEKASLIGYVAEHYSNKRTNDYIIYYACYQDPDLKERLFNIKDFDDLGDEELKDLQLQYQEKLTQFNEKSLKKLALNPDFLNSFYLCDNNPLTFYGKPIVELTFHQTALFSFAARFKNILSNSEQDVPEEVLKDPDKLLDWHNNSKNMSKALENSHGASTIVGATRQDYKNAGMDVNTNSLAKTAKKMNKTNLSMDDIIRSQGV